MAIPYKVDKVDRVMAVLQTQDPHKQIIRIQEVTGKPGCPEKLEELEEFPDEHVTNGTRVYMRWPGSRVFEICVLRG